MSIETPQTKIATEAGHWYDAKTGEPRYTIAAKSGELRNTTLRDAKKFGYVPSVTTITRIMEKPALGAWLQRQVLMAALTLTRKDGEPDDAWVARIMEDSKAQSVAAAERGTAVHGSIERFIQGQEHGHSEHIVAVCRELDKSGIDIHKGKAEHSFAHPDGFGGKIDLCGDGWVVDFKSKESIGNKTCKELAYDEHVCQLAAYAYGLGIEDPRCVNVFVGVSDTKVVVVEHDAAAIVRGLQMFKLMLQLWKIKNNVGA